ncbi:hypothetical protein AKO1_009982 [Acrasis kona]|uniref:Uncharacterized protein n=1 Tax=Acrasis kona TaxID=1008807 RepID=A0AAW2ZPS5_9EUKA
MCDVYYRAIDEVDKSLREVHDDVNLQITNAMLQLMEKVNKRRSDLIKQSNTIRSEKHVALAKQLGAMNTAYEVMKRTSSEIDGDLSSIDSMPTSKLESYAKKIYQNYKMLHAYMDSLEPCVDVDTSLDLEDLIDILQEIEQFGDVKQELITEYRCLWSWGNNGQGQLGLKDNQNRHVPHTVKPLLDKNIVSVVGGYGHTLALTASGTVYAFGRNIDGELGLGHNNNVSTPEVVESLMDKNVIMIDNSNVHHSTALTDNGEIYTWGNNRCGQLGLGDTINRNVPTCIPEISDKRINCVIAGGSANSGFVFATNELNETYVWGANSHSQLGLDNKLMQSSPKQMSALTNTVKVGLGYNHSVVLLSDGRVFSFGSNDHYELGHGKVGVSTNVPGEIVALREHNILDVCSGNGFSIALTAQGSLFSWGRNDHGMLGLGDLEPRTIPQPINTIKNVQIMYVEAGGAHVIAVSDQDEVYCWGFNGQGRLGIGKTTDQHTPQRVLTLSGKNVKCVVAGGWHSLALSI